MFEYKPGIYMIKCLVDNKVYIGSSVRVAGRIFRHIRILKRNRHFNLHLQYAWNKYKEENFEFSVLEYVEDRNRLLFIEKNYIDKFKSNDRDFGYNIIRDPTDISGANHPKFGKKHSEETKAKIAKGNTGKVLSKETRDKMSKIALNRTASNPFLGKTHSNETKVKMSLNHADVSGNKNPMYGKRHSPEIMASIQLKKGKLNKKQVLKIRELNTLGLKIVEIANAIGLSFGKVDLQIIRDVIAGKRYKYVY